MASRTTRKTVTFTKPLVLGFLDEVLPAGDYVVETDEDLLQGVSFPAYLRVSTIFHLQHASGNPLLARTMSVEPHEIDAALARDRGRPDPAPPAGDDHPHQPRPSRDALPTAERDAGERAENEGMPFLER
jgi:hypothetical protein